MSSWVRVQAPVRVLDAGGWSDTWFAHHGSVCNLAVSPGADAIARTCPALPAGEVDVHLSVPDYGDDYHFCPDALPGRHPLLEAAVRRWAPAGRSLEVTVSSAVPAGSSLGTSAAIAVALIAALQGLAEISALDGPGALAHAAHNIETVDLERQSGVQDQVAAAFGGANLVTISPYPDFQVQPLDIAPGTLQALERRVVTVYMGAHDSSAVHNEVIRRLTENGASADHLLAPLRTGAERAAAALHAGDLEAVGQAMTACTDAQAALHPSLVNPLARTVIEVAARNGALGWKVNGAGGPGGTVSIVGPEDPARMTNQLRAIVGLAVLPLRLAPAGAHVVDRA